MIGRIEVRSGLDVLVGLEYEVVSVRIRVELGRGFFVNFWNNG